MERFNERRREVMENKELLSGEISRELEKLKDLEQGSKAHSDATEDVCKLIKMQLELNES